MDNFFSDRAQKRGELKMRKLKSLAVPSTFLHLPSYLSKEPAPDRSKKALSETRRKVLRLDHAKNVQEFFESERVSTIAEIVSKFSKQYSLPDDVVQLKQESSLVFTKFSITEGGCLEALFNVNIAEDLSFEVVCKGAKLNLSKVAHINNKKKLNSLAELYNIIIFAKNYDIQQDASTHLAQCINEFQSLVSTFPPARQPQIEFLIEQLQLSLVENKKQRRYSVSLLSLAVLWENCSPALYSQILSDEVLCLPSRKRIHDLTHAFSVETGLSSSTRAYLQARAARLTDREKIVMLQEDEIYSAKRVEFANGKVTGINIEENKNDTNLRQATKTMLCIMVKSVAGNYFDIVALYPVNNLDSSILKKVFDKVIKEVVSLKFTVVANRLDAYSAN